MVVITKMNGPKKYALKRRIYLQDLKMRILTENNQLIVILSSEERKSAFQFTHMEALEVFVRHFEQAIPAFENDRDILIVNAKKSVEEKYGITNYSDSNVSISSLKSETKDLQVRGSFRSPFGPSSKSIILNRRRSNTQQGTI
eukprot:NODE_68_length_25399_cov_0.885771.p13 type:complete len:143 gc:universal NODE_68_length_25399_cov_0.885771:22995-23423(+)